MYFNTISTQFLFKREVKFKISEVDSRFSLLLLLNYIFTRTFYFDQKEKIKSFY